MPWKDASVEQLRLQVLNSAAAGVDSVAAICRGAGISRECFYKWKRRLGQAGPAGLADLSRAPVTHPNALSPALVELLIDTRRQHPTWGARKLRWFLQARGNDVPAASTVHEVIRRAGMVKQRKRARRRPDAPYPGAASGPGDVFCADFKGEFRLGDRSYCYPFTMQDMASRQMLACKALPRIDGVAVKRQMVRVFEAHGLPRAVRTDNGAPFGACGRLTPLSVWLVLMGVQIQRIQPGRPQQNGRLERLHRTLKAETTRPPEMNLARQQRRFNRFVREYNEERPHEALGGQTPSQRHTRSKREYTGRLAEPEYPGHYELARVNCKGYACWAGKRRYVSESLVGQTLGLVERSDGEWSVYFSHVEIARYEARTDRWELLSLY